MKRWKSGLIAILILPCGGGSASPGPRGGAPTMCPAWPALPGLTPQGGDAGPPLPGWANVSTQAKPWSGDNPQRAKSARLSPDRAFGAFVEGYFDGLFHFNPSRATLTGLHQYDAELPAYSRREIEAEIARSQRALRELSRIRREVLSRENQFDARWLENHIRGHLLNLDQIRMWEKNPDFYNGVISRALFLLVQRDFAPLDARLKSLVARERRVPEILQSARANLANPPAIYTTIAIRQVSSEMGFLEGQLPQTVARANDAALKAEFSTVNQRAVEEYKKFLQYLKTDLAPRSRGAFPIGAENYRKKLLYDEMVDTSLEQLLRIGEKALRKTQADFKATAAAIDPAKSPAEVLMELSRDHPDSDHLIGESQAVLEGLRKFVVSHEITTILSPENPQVVEAPPFLRALTFASMDTPGPLEEHSTEAFYNVTLPERDWSETQKEEHLRAFDRYSIQTTSIHEVFPGHYTQSLWLKRATSRVRKLLVNEYAPEAGQGSSSNEEGWAHYSEQMMLEEGYGEGDPKLLLFQLRAALLRICRYIVGIKMHTRGMTLEQGIAFFQKEGYMEQVNAEREARRGTADSTYLVYTLGKLEILKLREDYKRKVGDHFNLKEFHDHFLSFGHPPVKLIREEMLGNDSPTL